MRFPIYPLVLAVVFVLTTALSTNSQNVSVQKNFRYIIAGNVIDEIIRERKIIVLMDEDTFGPDSVKELFRLLDKRFPEPVKFFCGIYTSLDQLDTPEEADMPKDSGPQPRSPEDHHHRAIFIRGAENQIIRYTGKRADSTLTTIILKGTDRRG